MNEDEKMGCDFDHFDPKREEVRNRKLLLQGKMKNRGLLPFFRFGDLPAILQILKGPRMTDKEACDHLEKRLKEIEASPKYKALQELAPIRRR